ncbi:MAG: heme-binding protein [Haloarculaceae archaeon]
MTREPPATEEGWYALHDLRRIDWDAWRDAPERERDRAVETGIEYLQSHEAVEDADAGGSAVYSVVGHDADLLVVHLRPTMADLDTAQRRFERTDFAAFTERADSYVSVTEASGYSERAREYFEGEVDDDSGLAQYIQSRLHPEIPDAEFVSFYPMSKRRQPEQNWYDLPFDERAEHMKRHGDIGRGYAGQVEQMITGSVGIDDWEWGVTLWADDLTDVKDLLYEMRFDPSSSKYADFGPFYVGRRFPPEDLDALLAGEQVPTGGTDSETSDEGTDVERPATATVGHETGRTDAVESVPDAADATEAAGDADPTGSAHPGSAGEGDHPHADDETDTPHPGGEEAQAHGGADDQPESGTGDSEDDRSESATEGAEDDHPGGGGGRPDVSGDFQPVEDADARLTTLGLTGGEDYDDGDFALIFYSTADAADLADAVEDLRGSFDHYDRHVMTAVRAGGGQAAAVSIWTAREAAETAAGFLSDLPGIDEQYGGPLSVDEDTLEDADEATAGTEAADDTAEREGTADATADDAGDTVDDDTGTADAPDQHEAAGESETAPDQQTTTAGSDDADADDGPDIREQLADLDVYAGKPHGEDVYALVLYSEADHDKLAEKVTGLQESFGRYETHVKTAVYEAKESETAAVVSLWTTEQAANTAADFMTDLPGVIGRPEDDDGFGTMGMFYTVEPEYRDEFVETFDEVGGLLEEMDGHRETALLANRDDENDMFIASRWDSKEDAMAFFRSDEFAETVEWGRDVLADRPRHVFLA